MKRSGVLLVVLFCAAATMRGQGLSINLPLVGRVTGGGGTVFATSVDVSNNASSSVRVDFYFDGKDAITGEAASIVG